MYNGTTYGFCCKDCITEFKKNPAKYIAAAK
jgi:YHS domain-containing protein